MKTGLTSADADCETGQPVGDADLQTPSRASEVMRAARQFARDSTAPRDTANDILSGINRRVDARHLKLSTARRPS